MSAGKYRVVLHPNLAEQYARLAAAATRDPGSPAAQEFEGLDGGLDVLRDGEEKEHGGKRFNVLSEQYGDLSDCAEIKIPVFREFAPNGYEFGPSHRLVYQEFEPTADDPRPIRHVVAYARRENGGPFREAQRNLGRSASVDLTELAESSEARRRSRSEPPAPVRMPLPDRLTQRLMPSRAELFTFTEPDETEAEQESPGFG